MKFLKFFNDRALGLFSASALFGFLLCLRSEGLPVLNIVMWAVTGLSLLLFFVRLSVMLFGKDARFLAIKGGGAGQMFLFPALLLLYCRVLHQREYDSGHSVARPFRPVACRDYFSGDQRFLVAGKVNRFSDKTLHFPQEKQEKWHFI